MRENEIRERYQQPTSMPLVPQDAFFQTVAGPGETAYPEEGESNVYYGERLRLVSFVKEIGTVVRVSTGTGKYAFLYSEDYIAEGSVIQCFSRNGYWFVGSSGGSGGFAIRTGVLDAALSAPASVTGTPTTVAVSRYDLDSDTGLLEDSGETDTITNHDPTLTAGSGAFVRYTEQSGIYVPVWVGCDP